MARVSRSVTGRKYRKKIIKLASGYYGRAKSCYRIAIERLEKAWQYSYRDRRTRKRDFRALWTARINAAVRSMDSALKYSTFIDKLNKSGIVINRKMLAYMAVEEQEAFRSLVDRVLSGQAVGKKDNSGQ
jgi:large subunit ribosomal protein L20